MANQFDRRHLLAMIAATGAVSLLPAAAMAEPILGDVVLGDAAAPVTVIEYASFTCGHCARFHVETWPQLKATYVDTGKIRFILREVYFDREGLWASIAARCGGANAFYPIADQLMKKQNLWATAARGNDRGEIVKIARLNGLPAARLDACFSDQEYSTALVETYQQNRLADDVSRTPTFIIDGEKYEGNMAFDEISALIDAAL